MRALLLAALLAADAPAAAPDPWKELRPLLGEWEGTGSGDPGAGSGRFTFSLELQGRVLVRRARSAFAGPGGATVHEDLLVIHREEGELRARYWDGEGHVLDYAGAVAPDGQSVTFTTPARPGAPRFRLRYERRGEGRLQVSFAVAPPGQPEAFRVHVEGESRRTAAPR